MTHMYNLWLYDFFKTKSVLNSIPDCSLIIDYTKIDSIINLDKDVIILKFAIVLKIY